MKTKSAKVVRKSQRMTLGRLLQHREKGLSQEDIRYVIATNIRGAMGRNSIRQQDLAEALGVTQQCLSTYLSKHQPKFFPLLTLVDVAKYLQCTVADLCTPGHFPYDGPEDMRCRPRSEHAA